jgi:hypothetical protein
MSETTRRGRPATIFDVQGTLIDVRPIRHLVAGQHKDFDAFHKATGDCAPNKDVVRAAQQAHRDGNAVLVVTGMNAVYRRLVRGWLTQHRVPCDGLWTRDNGDYRKDVIVKGEILSTIRRWYEPDEAWDDNPAIVGLWEIMGLRVNVVPGWDDK